MDWELLKQRWESSLLPGEQIGLLHDARSEAWPPTTSLELAEELEPVEIAVNFYLDAITDGESKDAKVHATALTFALEISFPQHGESYCRVSPPTLAAILNAMIQAGIENAYQRCLSQEPYPAKIRAFLQKYASWKKSWAAKPRTALPTEWIQACVASGNMSVLGDFAGDDERAIAIIKAWLWTAEVRTERQLVECCLLIERREIVDFRRRWAEALALQSARCGKLNLF